MFLAISSGPPSAGRTKPLFSLAQKLSIVHFLGVSCSFTASPIVATVVVFGLIGSPVFVFCCVPTKRSNTRRSAAIHCAQLNEPFGSSRISFDCPSRSDSNSFVGPAVDLCL